MKNTTITTKHLFFYSMIALPLAFAGFPLYVLAPDFYATHHGLSLTLLGTLLLVIRLLDAIQDPIIGWLVDRWQNKYLMFISGAGLALCLAILVLFNTVFFNPAIWFALCLTVAVSAYSILTITLGAYATRWTIDQSAQTRIAGAREAFGLVGLVIAVSMPAVLSYIVAKEQIFVWYSTILLLMMAIGIICFGQLPQRATPTERTQTENIFSGLYAVSSRTRRFFLIYALSMLASSIPAVLVIFYVRDLLQAEHMMGVFLLLYFTSGVIGIPLWKNLSLRYGKYRTWALSNSVAVAGFIGSFFLSAGDVWPYGVVCIFSGFALGADLILPPSIIADDIHATNNSRFSAMHYSLMAFLSKAGLAVASAMTLPLLDAVAFQPQAANSQEALFALSVTYALLPCALKFVAVSFLYIFFIRSNSGGENENQQNTYRHRSSFHA